MMLQLFRRVLTPIDGATRIAVAFAIAQALIPAAGSDMIVPLAESEEGAIALEEGDLAALHTALIQARALGKRVHIVPWRGAHARDLTTLASRYKADIIVLAPRDSCHLELAWYPPRTAFALESLPIPILVYPPTASEQGSQRRQAAANDVASGTAERSENTIMVAFDEGAATGRSLAFAVGWARRSHGALLLAEVMTPMGDQGVTSLTRARALQQLAHAQKHIERLAGPLPLQIQSRLLIGNPAEQLLKCAEEEPVALIVAGAHHHASPSRFFVGNVATNLIRRAQLPILLIPTANTHATHAAVVTAQAPCAPSARETDEVMRVGLVSEDSSSS